MASSKGIRWDRRELAEYAGQLAAKLIITGLVAAALVGGLVVYVIMKVTE